MMMKILAFDPSLSNWGYSIANYHNKQLDILDYGVIQLQHRIGGLEKNGR